MTSADRLRQGVTVLLVAGLLVLSPALASARFVDGTTASVRVGTASLGQPSSAQGRYTCANQGGSLERLEVTVTGFSGSEAATSYRYAIYRAGTEVATATSRTRTVTFETPNLQDDGVATVWTLQVTSVMGAWTGTATVPLPCPEGRTSHVTF